jgi:hypothetical protein
VKLSEEDRSAWAVPPTGIEAPKDDRESEGKGAKERECDTDPDGDADGDHDLESDSDGERDFDRDGDRDFESDRGRDREFDGDRERATVAVHESGFCCSSAKVDGEHENRLSEPIEKQEPLNAAST